MSPGNDVLLLLLQTPSVEKAVAEKRAAVAVQTKAPVSAVAVTAAAADPCGAFECGMAMACCPTIYSPFGYFCAIACVSHSTQQHNTTHYHKRYEWRC